MINLQISVNEEMSISQLYDAFENILHIKMPKAEFDILFKKVSRKRNRYLVSYSLLFTDEHEKRWKYHLERICLLFVSGVSTERHCSAMADTETSNNRHT